MNQKLSFQLNLFFQFVFWRHYGPPYLQRGGTHIWFYIYKNSVGGQNWDATWETPNVPQQPPRSGACGLFIVRFMEKIEGTGETMSTFVVWDNLTLPKRTAVVKAERNALAFQILTCLDNVISDEVVKKVNDHAKVVLEEKKARKKPKAGD